MPEVTIEQAMQAARQLENSGKGAEAEQIYRQILSVNPSYLDAMNRLGVMAAMSRRYDAAIDCFARMAAIQPGLAWVHGNLGEIYRRAGRLDEAIAELRKSVALDATHAIGFYNLGVALADRRQWEEAIAAYKRAVTLDGSHAEIFVNLGGVLQRVGRLDEAVEAYREALRIKPDLAEAHNNLGNVFRDKFFVHDAVVAYRKAMELRPAYLEACVNLGSALKDLGQLDEAVATYRQAMEMDSNSAMVHNNLGNALKDQGRLDEALACFERTVALSPNDAAVHSNLILSRHYHPGFGAAALLEECREWDRRHGEPLRAEIVPHGNERSPERRLRIGYVSADLREHSVAHFLTPLLAHHDRGQVEVFCYSAVRRADAQTRRIKGLCDQWRNIMGVSDAETAAMIREDRIDVLVDLALHSAENRLLTFARKPAPVQVTWLGYAGTTGLSTMDYRLSDPFLDPPGTGDGFYSEKMVRLAHTFWCYQPMLETVEVNGLPAIGAGRVTFGCFNNFGKVTPATVALWARVLAAVPNSRIVIYSGQGSHRDLVRGRFGEAGVSAERVEFAGFQPMEKYYQRYHEVDVVLDPFPFGGGTTTCDALWMGVPVVTLAGGTAVGRGGVSLLSNLGLPEWIARTPEEYIAIAVTAAGNLTKLAELRGQLRRRMQSSPLTDAGQFARDVEGAFREMWRTWCTSAAQ